MIVLIMALFFKSFILDNYEAKNDSEEQFKIKIEQIISERYDSQLYKNKILVVRIVKISEMNDREKISKDKDGNKYIAKGIYKAKIRKYILGFLPYSEERILDINLN